METFRKSTFETNSSSCHCMVVAGENDFQKFVDGELFADEGSYKCPYQATLITLDEVVRRYQKYVDDENDFNVKNNHPEYCKKMISAEMIKWIMLHPDFFDPDIDVNYEKYMTEHRDGLSDEEFNKAVEDNFDAVDDFTSWIYMDYTPYSYRMLDYETGSFTSEYDDYKSAPVHDVTMKDGSTVKELNAVWYY